MSLCVLANSPEAVAAWRFMMFHKPTWGFLWGCFQRRLAAQWSYPVISFAPKFLTAKQPRTWMFKENHYLSELCRFHLMWLQLHCQIKFKSMPSSVNHYLEGKLVHVPGLWQRSTKPKHIPHAIPRKKGRTREEFLNLWLVQPQGSVNLKRNNKSNIGMDSE